MITRSAVVLPQKQSAASRRLVVVDLENVAGGAIRSVEVSQSAWQQVGEAIGLGDTDHVVVGASHISAIAAWRGRPSARVVVRSGPSGAELALLGVLEEESVESRFTEVVVVSGDQIFTDAVARLGACGVRVTVVAHPDGLARRLRMASANQIALLGARPALGGVA